MRVSLPAGHYAVGAGSSTLLSVASVLAAFAHACAFASAPAGADDLATYGAWSVFQYPRDPWGKCYMASEPIRSEGAARLLVDVGAGDISLVRRPGQGYRRRGGDEVPQVTVTVGSQSFPFWYEPFTDPYERPEQENPDERMVQVMKASEAESADAELIVRGESWRGPKVTDAFSLQGFTAAHDATDGRICKARQPPAGTRSAFDLSSVNVDRSKTSSKDWYTEIRLVGPFFAQGEREALVIRAIPLDEDTRFDGLSFVDARLDFFRGESLIGREFFHYYTNLAEVCVSPESGRLEIIVTSSTGGSSGWTDSYFLFFDPHTGRVATVDRASHGEEIYDEIGWVDNGSFVPSWCPYREYMASVESFARSIMKAVPNWRDPEFADDIFSAYLDLIVRLGPDSPLRFERLDTSEFSIVDMKHSGYGFRDAFQTIFVKEADGARWAPIYHADPNGSADSSKLADVYGFVEEDTLRMHMCVKECVASERGEWEDVDFNLR